MAAVTEYLGLTKPTEEEYVSVDVINENMEKIDLEARSARPVKKGGTGKTSWAANRLIYASAAEVLAQMAFPTTAGSFLCQGTSGVPYWSTPAQVLAAIGAATANHNHTASDVGSLPNYEKTTNEVLGTYDLDEVTTAGIYRINSSNTKTPVSPQAGDILEVLLWDANTLIHRYWKVGISDAKGFWRARIASGAWSNWIQIGDFKADGSVAMTGDLKLGGGYGAFAASDKRVYIGSRKDKGTSDTRILEIHNSADANTLAESIVYRDVVGGANKSYYLLGTHNKPSGSYTGNGSAATRTITINNVVGTVLLIDSDHAETVAWITNNGGVAKLNDGTLTAIPASVAKFAVSNATGTVTINSALRHLNENGKTYKYSVQ